MSQGPCSTLAAHAGRGSRAPGEELRGLRAQEAELDLTTRLRWLGPSRVWAFGQIFQLVPGKSVGIQGYFMTRVLTPAVATVTSEPHDPAASENQRNGPRVEEPGKHPCTHSAISRWIPGWGSSPRGRMGIFSWDNLLPSVPGPHLPAAPDSPSQALSVPLPRGSWLLHTPNLSQGSVL